MLPSNMKYVPGETGSRKQTTIAQISDLHFTAQTKHADSEWQALALDLKNQQQKIDLLVVTGDLIDGGFRNFFQKDEASLAFSNVESYLNKICEQLDIDPEERLVVVPGNHDYRMKGLINKRAQSEHFERVFGSRFRPVFLGSLGICVLAVDSNALEKGINLATGLVEKKDLLSFIDLVDGLRTDQTMGWNSCTKIVLLHHHPMPIAATEGRGFLEQPGFLLLKNAGQFMTSMVESKIDLILHGHQHYPAYSKASFPTATGEEHLITIIGAGSVGREVRNYHRSYNIVTITSNREIHLERRVLPAFKYESALRVPIRTFEDARRLAFETLAAKAGAKLRARKFSRLYAIKSDSGDADIYERLDEVSAYNEDVREFKTSVKSDTGFFDTPRYESADANIEWHWKTLDLSPKREASIRYEPPITKDHPITYERRNKAYNLFHFNQQEREDATDGAIRDEFVELTIQNAFDLLVVTLSFPELHFPDKFYREVHDNTCFGKEHGPNCRRDPEEERYFNLHFSKFRDARTIVASLEKPLPGYTYWIYWKLPPMEEDERHFSATDKGQAADLGEKLLQLTSPDKASLSPLKAWLEEMRRDIITSKLWADVKGDDELEISLYAYDSNERGLRCVARSPGSVWQSAIKSGQTLIGAAYRRREHMLYSPLVKSRNAAHIIKDPEYLLRVPPDWRNNSRPYTALCAIPLIYPIAKGCKVGVLTFATKSMSSKLIEFVPQKNTPASIKAAGDALVEDVMLRQVQRLAVALSVDQVPI